MTIQPLRPYQPEKVLIENIVAATGMEPDAAEAAARAVFAGVETTITANQKSVSIPGVGRISAPEKRRHYKGDRKRGQKYRKTTLSGVEVWAGEPWEIDYDLRR